MHDEIAPLALEMEADLLDGLDEQELEVLDRVIDKLYGKAQLFTKAHE